MIFSGGGRGTANGVNFILQSKMKDGIVETKSLVFNVKEGSWTGRVTGHQSLVLSQFKLLTLKTG